MKLIVSNNIQNHMVIENDLGVRHLQVGGYNNQNVI